MPWTKNTSGCHRPAGWGNQIGETSTREERAIVDDYGQRFRETDSSDVIAIEQAVLGSAAIFGVSLTARAKHTAPALR